MRQTGRHAMTTITQPRRCAATTAATSPPASRPASQRDFESLIDWLDDPRLRATSSPRSCSSTSAVERGGVSIAEIATDRAHREIFGAGREALIFLADATHRPTTSSSAARRAGSRAAWCRHPRRRSRTEHFVARGFPVEVEHDELGRTYRYPGAPFLMPASPWRISPAAPRLGEHDAEILGD